MATQPYLSPFLGRLNRRSILSPAEQQRILDLPGRIFEVYPNSDIVGLGDSVAHSCLVVSGLVGRFDQNSRGERQITALHIPGDMSDLYSLVQPTAASALQALSPATLLAIPHTALCSAVAAYPAIGEALWRDSMADAVILAQWVLNVGRREAKVRLAHLFCEMACRYGEAPRQGQVRFNLHMTQTQLADATGLTPVHVNRKLKSLRTEGMIMRHRTVWIDDWKKFAEVAEFDEGYLQTDVAVENRLRMVG